MALTVVTSSSQSQLTSGYAAASTTLSEQSEQEKLAALKRENQRLKQQLAQVEAHHQSLNHLIDAMPTGVILLDGNGIVTKVNEIARQLLDEPILGQIWSEVIARSFKPREDDWHEVSLKDGRRVKLDIRPLPNQPGQLITITDLTETRLLQDKISRMQRLSSLGRMVSSLAHQIRTPLSAAMLYGANLKSSHLSDQDRNGFQQKLMSRLSELEQQVNDMLLFAKSGQQQIVEPIHLRQVIKQAISQMDWKVQQHQSEISFVDNTPQSSDLLLGNATAIKGALQNLIDNSLQIIKNKANIRIQLECQHDFLYVGVQDNGPGIDAQLQNAIFEPFVTNREQGTGLGLAVVKAVANAHRGDVSVLPVKKGACFVLKFPCANSQASVNQDIGVV